MPSRATTRPLRPAFAALAALAIALAVVALATPAHGLTPDEAAPDESGAETSSFVVDAGEPVDALEDECFEEEEEGEEEDAAEEEEEGEEEECEAEAQGADALPPAECLLRTTSARVFTYEGHDKVRLVLRYTALAPTEATVDYRLKGSRGSLRIGEASKHLGRRGVLRASERLSESQMDRVRAAKSFEVQLRIPSAPGFCSRYFSKDLTVRHGGRSHAVWSEAAAPGA